MSVDTKYGEAIFKQTQEVAEMLCQKLQQIKMDMRSAPKC